MKNASPSDAIIIRLNVAKCVFCCKFSFKLSSTFPVSREYVQQVRSHSVLGFLYVSNCTVEHYCACNRWAGPLFKNLLPPVLLSLNFRANWFARKDLHVHFTWRKGKDQKIASLPILHSKSQSFRHTLTVNWNDSRFITFWAPPIKYPNAENVILSICDQTLSFVLARKLMWGEKEYYLNEKEMQTQIKWKLVKNS